MMPINQSNSHQVIIDLFITYNSLRSIALFTMVCIISCQYSWSQATNNNGIPMIYQSENQWLNTGINPSTSVPEGATGETLIRQTNEHALQLMNFNRVPTQEEILKKFENDRHGINEKSQKERQLQQLYSLMAEDESKMLNEPVDLREKELQKALPNFAMARKELESMIDKKKPVDLKRAVFLSEYPEEIGSTEYSKYLRSIARLVAICKQTVIESHRNIKDPDALQWAIQRLFKDTFAVTLHKKRMRIYPFTYDFEDFQGKEDISKVYVTKLLTTHSGQCHSMPLLYLILARELHVSACIAYSPNHSFIKYKDRKGIHNFETTSGCFTMDIDIISSGYVSIEAVENGIYMRPNSIYETLASCLGDLIQNYEDKFGEDSFALSGTAFILDRFPHHTEGWMIKAHWINWDFKKLHTKLNKPKYAELSKHPDLKEKVLSMQSINDQMDALGFADFPKEAYLAWLKGIKLREEKQKKAQHTTKK